MTNSQGAIAQLAIDSSTIDTNSTRLHFIAADPGVTYNYSDDNDFNISGSYSHLATRVAQGLVDVRPSIRANPTPVEWDAYLPWMLGADEAADVFNLDDTPQTRNVAMDTVSKVHTLANCKVDTWTAFARKGGKLGLNLELMGESESVGNAGTFPSIALAADNAYEFYEGVLDIEGLTDVAFNQVAIIGQNRLEREYNHSRTSTEINQTDRVILLQASTPWTSSETALYTNPISTGAGATCTVTFTNGGQSLEFSFVNLKVIAASPQVNGKREIRYQIRAKAYKSGSTNELVVTNDSAA